MKNIFIVIISMLFIAPFALANEMILGEWEYQSVVCGVPGYSPPEMIAPPSTTTFNNDGTMQVVAPIPAPEMGMCSLVSKGTYSVEESKIIIEFKSMEPDTDCLKAQGLDEEKIRETAEMLSITLNAAQQREREGISKLSMARKEQEFVMDKGILYTEHNFSDTFSKIFCEGGETMYFKSIKKQ